MPIRFYHFPILFLLIHLSTFSLLPAYPQAMPPESLPFKLGCYLADQSDGLIPHPVGNSGTSSSMSTPGQPISAIASKGSKLIPIWSQFLKNNTAPSDAAWFDGAAGRSGRLYFCGKIDSMGQQSNMGIIAYQANGEILWHRQVNGNTNGNDMALTIEILPNGDLIVAGFSEVRMGLYAPIVLCLNAAGQTLWELVFPELAGPNSQFNRVVIGNYNQIILSGIAEVDETGEDIFVLSLNSDGQELWRYFLDGGAALADRPFVLQTTPDGAVVVGGFVNRANEERNMVVTRLSGEGVEEWSFFYDGRGGRDVLTTLQVADNGDIWGSGFSTGSNGYDMVHFRLNDRGHLNWLERFDGNAGLDDIPTASTLDEQGNYIVTGYSLNHRGDPVGISQKMSGTNGLRWSKPLLFAEGIGFFPNSVDLLENQIIIGGTVARGIYDQSATAIAIDGGGEPLWQQTIFDNEEPLSYSEGSFLAGSQLWFWGWHRSRLSEENAQVSALSATGAPAAPFIFTGSENSLTHFKRLEYGRENNLVLAGEMFSREEGWQMQLLDFSETGSERWRWHYHHPVLQSVTKDMALAENGSIFLAGDLGNRNQSRAMAISLSRLGLQQWVYQSNNPDGLADRAIAIVPANNGSSILGIQRLTLNEGQNMTLVKLNPNGSTEWQYNWNGPGNGHDQIQSLGSYDERVIVAGNTENSAGEVQGVIWSLDFQGQLLWQNRENPFNLNWVTITSLLGNETGVIAVLGSGYSEAGQRELFVRALNREGEQLWCRNFTGESAREGQLTAIWQENGELLLANSISGIATPAAVKIMSLGQDGQLQWLHRVQLPWENTISLHHLSSGRDQIILGGYLFQDNGQAASLLAGLSPDGDLNWVEQGIPEGDGDRLISGQVFQNGHLWTLEQHSSRGNETPWGTGILNRYFLGGTAVDNYSPAKPAPDDKMLVFPNPSYGDFSVEIIGDASRLRVYNLLGQLLYERVFEQQADPKVFSIKGENWASGHYFICLEGKEGVHTRRITILR